MPKMNRPAGCHRVRIQKPQPPPEELVEFYMLADRSFLQRIFRFADRQGLPPQWVITRAIEEYINQPIESEARNG